MLKTGFGHLPDNRFELGFIFANNSELTQQTLIKNLYGVQINTISPFTFLYNEQYPNNLLPFVATEFRYAHLFFSNDVKEQIDNKNYIYAFYFGINAGLQIQILQDFALSASYGISYINAQKFAASVRNCRNNVCDEKLANIKLNGTSESLRFEFSYFF